MIIKTKNRNGRPFFIISLMEPMEAKAYRAWRAMVGRCMNHGHTAYSEYGGRGIKVCAQWRSSFENFVADVGLPPSNEYSIDRTNPNGNYEPGIENGKPKVKWALLDEQHRNRRNTHWIEINGERHPLSTWARRADVDVLTFMARVKKGMTGPDLLRPTNFHLKKFDVGEGRILSVQEIISESGCSQCGIWLRIKRGVRGSELLQPSRTQHHKGYRGERPMDDTKTA